MDVVISFPILKKNRLKEGLGRAVVEEAAAGYKQMESLVLWVMKSSSPGGCRVELRDQANHHPMSPVTFAYC